MIRITVVYGLPADPASFNSHYETVHVPLVLAMPELNGFEYSVGDVSPGEGTKPAHMVAVMTYPDHDTLSRSFGSPEGQAAIADVANFATGGASIYTAEFKSALFKEESQR
ncbi:EthD family reductase [Agrobacterium sp. LAD9]|uniref:EthD family reductase n=1 Tax=Agrobacterium sp. LAD9 TaxID=2055153 RepID=UPI000D1E704A|nr:EthD family reductase [Agrobacterium sp. LAD9]